MGDSMYLRGWVGSLIEGGGVCACLGEAYVVDVCVMLLWLLVLLMAKVEELLLWLESKSRSQRHWDDLR